MLSRKNQLAFAVALGAIAISAVLPIATATAKNNSFRTPTCDWNCSVQFNTPDARQFNLNLGITNEQAKNGWFDKPDYTINMRNCYNSATGAIADTNQSGGNGTEINVENKGSHTAIQYC